jgi:hypothetical protein
MSYTNIKINKDSQNIISNKLTCTQYRNFTPSFTPIINSLSVTTSNSGDYSLVYIIGLNFLPNGTTYINFGDNYTNIPVTYYSSFNISFIVPQDAPAGLYNVVAVNIYNGNFGPPVKYPYPANLNYSNPTTYILT